MFLQHTDSDFLLILLAVLMWVGILRVEVWATTHLVRYF